MRAEVMIFRPDGSVRVTDGWTDHRDRSETNAVVAMRSPATTPDILQAIRITAERHAGTDVLDRLALSPEDWHALFRSLIEAESAYRPDATSPKGAFGLGQLMPATARALGVDRTDPVQNLDGSARYLLAQLDAFRDIDLALAAYNAGPHRVTAYGGVPPFAETRSYIARVHRIRARLSGGPARRAMSVLDTRFRRPALVLDLNQEQGQ